jgi:GT2 family glycosyltransferase
MTPGAGPRLSIVVPSYNGRRLLETCLASIERHTPEDIPLEVVVVDDGSTDDTVSWVASNYPWIKLIARTGNGGFCAAANDGIAAASGEFIQVLNNDTEMTPGWVEAGLAPFDDPTVGSVAPLVLVRSDSSRVDSAGDCYAFFGWPYKRGHGEPAARWRSHPSDHVFGASGTAAFYRARALKHVGAFDPLFGSYYEDVDLAFRLRWAGYSCRFAPDCVILHEISATYVHTSAELQRRMARNAEIVFWSNLPTLNLLAGLAPHAAFTLTQLAWKAVRGQAMPFLQGKIDALHLQGEIARRRHGRIDLGRRALRGPHFPLALAPLRASSNHLRRPSEASSRSSRI